MRWTVVLAHAEGEEDRAKAIATPLLRAGYKVWHRGTVLVGESFSEEAQKALAEGGPVVLCATVRAMGTGFAKHLVAASRPFTKNRVFILKMEEEADVESIGGDRLVADYWNNSDVAIHQLIVALQKRFPPAAGGVFTAAGGTAAALSVGDIGIRIPLTRKQFLPPDRRRYDSRGATAPRELDLLIPEAGRLPLVGRNDVFDELRDWLNDDANVSVHALIGRAGIGKTRVALEFCREVDSDPTEIGEWVAGFLSARDVNHYVEALVTHSVVWERSNFLVIDYAAQCHQSLARWLDRLAYVKFDRKVRLLLLDREAPESFGWWHELARPF